MYNDVAVNSIMGVFLSLLITYLPVLQGVVVFALTVIYFVCKIRDSRMDIEIKKRKLEQMGGDDDQP